VRVAVLGSREMVYGFRLAGIEADEVEPGPEAAARFAALTEAEDVAVIVLGHRLSRHLRDDVIRLRTTRALPAVVTLPDRGEAAVPETAAQLLAQYLGVRV